MKAIFKKFAVGLAATLLLGVLSTCAQDKGDQLAIIVGKSSSMDAVTAADLQKYFKAEKSKTPDGTKIVIVMQDVGQPARDAALHEIFQMSEAEYNDYFAGQVFTGAVKSAPKACPSSAAMKEYVAATPGALGYVKASEADDSVKVLKVDGKAPGDADYGLKIK